jgi:dTDP-4-amino-4,6-dideoxygalactose transaminase
LYSIYLSPPHLTGFEKNYIEEALQSNWVSPYGNNIDAFEKELEEYLDIPYAALITSATAGLHLALVILGVSRNDIVLVPTFTFAACVNPIIYVGAEPVFLDSEMDTWNLDPLILRASIEDLVKQGRKPKALILVHSYGVPAKITEIISICREFGILVIEDAADALGATYQSQKLGTFGDIGVISFNGNKIITTSGGGVLVSKNKEYVERAKYLGNQAKANLPYYHHEEVGYNYRMSNILAGIGRAQLQVIDERVVARRENYEFYKGQFEIIYPSHTFSQKEMLNAYSNRWLSTFHLGKDINLEVHNSLKSAHIESRFLWKPMHLQPAFLRYKKFLNGNAATLFEAGICLPSGSQLNSSQKKEIAAIIGKVLNPTINK